MEPNEVVAQDQETVQVAAETTEETLTPEQIADLKKKADASSQNFERAKKAETELKEAREKLKDVPSNQKTLANKDIIYLAKADIHADDMDEVLEMAQLKKWDVQKAHDYLKPVLDTRAEQRRTAAASHTGGGARGTSKVSGEDLLQKAQQTGEVPVDDAGMQALFRARTGAKK